MPSVWACSGNQTLCGQHCSDMIGDPSNCGACGKSCDVDQVCSAGKCTSACASGTTSVGNGTDAGRIQAFATFFHPTNQGEIWVTTRSHDIWRTSDSGQT